MGLTLAFATIPEELPILITMVLGIGAYRLAKQRAIVRGLRAAETLGSVSVIATDKTGTLTLNQMHVVDLLVGSREISPEDMASSSDARNLMEAAVLANDAQSAEADGKRQYIGDLTETALLRAADQGGVDSEVVRHAFEAREEFPFSDDRKRMSVLGIRVGRWLIAAKGSPESILAICSEWREGEKTTTLDETARETFRARADTFAQQGRRVLAVAARELAPAPADQQLTASDVERDLVFLGLVALEDPPRAEAAAAVGELRRAGVRILMVTGDHPATATAIAKQVGIDTGNPPVRGAELESASSADTKTLVETTSIFARSTPQDKLTIVRTLQDAGEIVAVTGDGVNDAPALKQAAIGVAMGKSGTAVAREAASLILADDNFATVAQAVRTGRMLFANLRKAVRYYLAAKVALVSASLVAVLLRHPVPFEPVQIIVMELFMDLGASVTFVAERAERDLMAQPPRDPRAPFMDREMQLRILFGGAALGAAVLVGYLGATQFGASVQQAQTVAFIAWMIGHVVLAANMRTEREPILRGAVFRNRPFLLWAAAAVAVTVTGLAWPLARQQFHLVSPPGQAVAVACVAAVLIPSWESGSGRGASPKLHKAECMFRKLRRMGRRDQATAERVMILWLCAQYPRVGRFTRWLARAGALYAYSPIDFIPDFIPVLGHLDDLLIIPFVARMVQRRVSPQIWSDATTQAQSWGAARGQTEKPASIRLALWIATVMVVLLLVAVVFGFWVLFQVLVVPKD